MKTMRVYLTLSLFTLFLLLPLVGCTPGTPVADFTATPTAGTAPLSVQFTDTSRIEKSESITGWAWDFGDGTTSTEQNPVHVYTTAGTRTVALTVTGDDGKSDTVSKADLITVSNPSVTVPNVVGMTQAAAQTSITGAGLTMGAVTEQHHATVPAGQVISQNPAAGGSVPPGSAVALVVSKGVAPVTVPNVVGMNQAAAQTAITGAGLTVGAVTEQHHATVPAGQVISQNPAAGASVAPGSAVALVVSKGVAPVTVPNVVGMTQAAAQTAITGAGLTVGTVTEQFHATVPSGQVISQNPAAGASVAPGSAVALVVSKGVAPVTVPNVVGMTQAAAQTSITGAGLTVGTVTEQHHATVPAGKVISQNPAAGASVSPGSAVALVVSKGVAPVTVPNVVGMTQAAAQTSITGAGLAVGTVTEQFHATIPSGQVISQSPAAGASVAPGSAVALVVSLGPETNETIIGGEGGTIVTETGAGLEVPDGQLNREVLFSLDKPADSEIRETLDGSVPYAGALTLSAAPTPADPETPVEASALSMVVTLPITPALAPGTLLDVYQKGEIPGEWILLDQQATVNPDGVTASFSTKLVGTFIVRAPDDFSVPTLNYDEPDKDDSKANVSFVPAMGFGLHRVPFHAGSNQGNGTVPIILIHGVGSHEATQSSGGAESPGNRYARWDNFIQWCVSGGIDMNTYQLWIFLHKSYDPVGYDYGAAGELTPNNVRTLVSELENARANKGFPGAGQQFLIIAHSRGGLVARAFVEKSGMAEQVMAAITLATPHHGSPLAVPEWGYHVLFKYFSLPVTGFDIVRLAGTFKSVAWWLPGYSDLAWDNFDGTAPQDNGIPDRTFRLNAILNGVTTNQHHLTTNDAGWPRDTRVTDPSIRVPDIYQPGRRAGATLWDLNHGPGANSHIDKFILYGGYITSPLLKSLWEHAGLQVLVLMMQRCESHNATVSHFAANDGMVPLQSALFLNAHAVEPIYAVERGWWGMGWLNPKKPLELDMNQISGRVPLSNRSHARIFADLDHLDMVAGKGVLFDKIGDDLDDTVLATPVAAFTVSGNSGGTVTLDASASADRGTALWPVTPSNALSYRADWGVGAVPQYGAWQSSPVLSHAYAAGGTRTITLQTRDRDGMIGTVSKSVSVSGGGGDTVTILLPGGVPLELVRIPAGSFQMGSPGTERNRYSDEGPVHTVNIGYDFYMGKYEVTQAQWLAVMGSRPGGLTWEYGQGDNHPAYYVSWEDAKDFIARLNTHITATGQGPATVRLPSEAEWEYACRAGTTTRFYFGDSLGVGDSCEDDGMRSQYMWYCGNNTPYGTKPVGGMLPNVFGLYDMHGNVWEWCEDWWHSSYTGAPTDGSAWVVPSASDRVIRGGYWYDRARYCRSAYRDNYSPSGRYGDLGFRLASVR